MSTSSAILSATPASYTSSWAAAALRWIQRLSEARTPPPEKGEQELLSCANGEETEVPSMKGPAVAAASGDQEEEGGHARMLDLMSGLAESVSEEGTATGLAYGCFPVREAMGWKRAHRASVSNDMFLQVC